MADEVPAQARGQRRLLGQQFLHLVLAEQRLAGLHSFLNHFHWEGLRDGQQFDIGGLAAGAFSGLGKALANGGEMVGDSGHYFAPVRGVNWTFRMAAVVW